MLTIRILPCLIMFQKFSFLRLLTIFSSFSHHKFNYGSVSFPFPISIHRFKSSPDGEKNVDRAKGASRRSKVVPHRPLEKSKGSISIIFLFCLKRNRFLWDHLFRDKKDESSVVFVLFGSEYFYPRMKYKRLHMDWSLVS